jgi:hypothetical protein
MKRGTAGSIFFLVTLALSLTAVAQERHNGFECVCTPALIAGTWGYTETGWLILPAPTGAIPYASVGRLVIDPNGNVSGARTASAAGTLLKGTITGSITVNPDCTGTLTQTITEQTGTSTPGTKSVVFLNNGTEANMLVTPNGMAVLTVVAKKMFPDGVFFPGR